MSPIPLPRPLTVLLGPRSPSLACQRGPASSDGTAVRESLWRRHWLKPASGPRAGQCKGPAAGVGRVGLDAGGEEGRRQPCSGQRADQEAPDSGLDRGAARAGTAGRGGQPAEAVGGGPDASQRDTPSCPLKRGREGEQDTQDSGAGAQALRGSAES